MKWEDHARRLLEIAGVKPEEFAEFRVKYIADYLRDEIVKEGQVEVRERPKVGISRGDYVERGCCRVSVTRVEDGRVYYGDPCRVEHSLPVPDFTEIYERVEEKRT